MWTFLLHLGVFQVKVKPLTIMWKWLTGNLVDRKVCCKFERLILLLVMSSNKRRHIKTCVDDTRLCISVCKSVVITLPSGFVPNAKPLCTESLDWIRWIVSLCKPAALSGACRWFEVWRSLIRVPPPGLWHISVPKVITWPKEKMRRITLRGFSRMSQ